jgi:hypothetical protein
MRDASFAFRWPITALTDPMTADDPIDFRELDPRSYPGAEDRVVRAAMARIRSRAAPARWRDTLADELAAHPRLILAAAALVIAVSSASLLRTPAPRQRPGPRTIGEAMGIPAAVERLENGLTPSSGELWSIAQGVR